MTEIVATDMWPLVTQTILPLCVMLVMLKICMSTSTSLFHDNNLRLMVNGIKKKFADDENHGQLTRRA